MLRLDNGYAISAVPPPMVPEGFPYVRRFLEEALEHAWGHSIEDVYVKLCQGNALLWIVEKDSEIRGALVTELYDYPRCKVLFIWLMAGTNLAEWKPCIAELEMYARHNKCDFIEANCRPGLKKMLADLEFQAPLVTCVRPVNHSSH